MTHARERLIALARPSTRFSVRLSIRTVVVFSMPIFKENTFGHIRSATGRPSRKIKRANKARLLRRGRGCLRWWRRLCHVQRRGVVQSEWLCARHRIGDDQFALQIAELIE